MLLEEELRLRAHSDAVFFASAKGIGSVSYSDKKPKKKFTSNCYYCDKKGHLVKDCHKNLANEKNVIDKASW